MKNRMKSLIVYDSMYGNTEKIAKAIGDGLTGEVKVVRVGEVNPAELKTFDLLILGSPVHGGRPTPAIDVFSLVSGSMVWWPWGDHMASCHQHGPSMR